MDSIAKYVSFNFLDSSLSSTLFGRNITSNLISYLWHRYWNPQQMIRFGFSSQDTVNEIYQDKSVEILYRDYFLRTFTWGAFRRSGFHAELKRLKNDLEKEPNWKIHVPLLYVYGGKDAWVTDQHIECVIKNMNDNIPKEIVKYPQGKHLLPIKDSSQRVNQFLSKYVFYSSFVNKSFWYKISFNC